MKGCIGMDIVSGDLSDRQFKNVSDIIYRECGDCSESGKEALVRPVL